MAGILGIGADDPVISSSSRRSWISASFRDPSDVFRRSTAAEDDEENLRWAAIERLPTYDRMRRGILRELGDNGMVTSNEVDLQKLGMQERKILVDRIMKIVEEDNERFLKRLRDRFNHVGLVLPKIEARFHNLSAEADSYSGSRALPTLLNATINTLEGIFGFVRFGHSKKRVKKILTEVSGVLKPSRSSVDSQFIHKLRGSDKVRLNCKLFLPEYTLFATMGRPKVSPSLEIVETSEVEAQLGKRRRQMDPSHEASRNVLIETSKGKEIALAKDPLIIEEVEAIVSTGKIPPNDSRIKEEKLGYLLE